MLLGILFPASLLLLCCRNYEGWCVTLLLHRFGSIQVQLMLVTAPIGVSATEVLMCIYDSDIKIWLLIYGWTKFGKFQSLLIVVRLFRAEFYPQLYTSLLSCENQMFRLFSQLCTSYLFGSRFCLMFYNFRGYKLCFGFDLLEVIDACSKTHSVSA